MTVVDAPDWVAAFDALDAPGLHAALVGRTLRVPAEPQDVRRALGPIPAAVHRAPMTLAERFVELSTAGTAEVRPAAYPVRRGERDRHRSVGTSPGSSSSHR